MENPDQKSSILESKALMKPTETPITKTSLPSLTKSIAFSNAVGAFPIAMISTFSLNSYSIPISARVLPVSEDNLLTCSSDTRQMTSPPRELLSIANVLLMGDIIAPRVIEDLYRILIRTWQSKRYMSSCLLPISPPVIQIYAF